MEHFGKKIHVNSSSLIDLKAELFKKQQEFKQNKLQTEAVLKLKGSSQSDVVIDKTVGVNKNKGVDKRNAKDLEKVAEETSALEKSRKALEAKTKIYDRLSKGGDIPEDANELYMVDFQTKALQVPQFPANRPDSMKITATPTDDDWVDYVDSLGRSRRCLRKDLPVMIEMDANLSSKAKPVGNTRPDLMSSDMEMEMQRQVWEQEEMEAKPVGPVHYQNVKFDEIRNHGVGYFAFDTDESKRQEQMKMLNDMRDQTEELRKRKEKVKEKRKKMLEDRLQKIKLRKKLKTDSDKESDDEKVESIMEEPIVAIPEPELEPSVEIKPKIVRPWDMGKPGVKPVAKKPFREMSDKEWAEKKRTERPREFAPPPTYYDDMAEQFLRKTFPHPIRNPTMAAGVSGNFMKSSSHESTELDDIPLPNLP